MILAEDIIFSNATGLAKSFLDGNNFDFVAFEQAVLEENIIEVITDIASVITFQSTTCPHNPNLKLP